MYLEKHCMSQENQTQNNNKIRIAFFALHFKPVNENIELNGLSFLPSTLHAIIGTETEIKTEIERMNRESLNFSLRDYYCWKEINETKLNNYQNTDFGKNLFIKLIIEDARKRLEEVLRKQSQ